MLICDMVAARTKRWAKPEIKHGHQNPIIKHNQEEWKFYERLDMEIEVGYSQNLGERWGFSSFEYKQWEE